MLAETALYTVAILDSIDGVVSNDADHVTSKLLDVDWLLPIESMQDMYLVNVPVVETGIMQVA